MQINIDLKQSTLSNIVSALKKNGDYDDLKGALLYLLTKVYKTKLNEDTYIKVFGRYLETITYYCMLKGDRSGFVYNMLIERISRQAGQMSEENRVEEIKVIEENYEELR